MTEQRSLSMTSGPLSEALSGVFAAAIVWGVAYLMVGGIAEAVGYKEAPATRIAQSVVGALFALLTLAGAFNEVRQAITRKKASDANKRVTEAFEKIHAAGADQDVAQISAKQIAAEAADAPVGQEHLERLAEQVKQKALLDDRYLQEDVKDLIVEYLQPLPRNAKRVLNRLRVSRLIADKRGLFTTEPRVNVEQISKWLVLGERWPQLGRSLMAAPAKMADLEVNVTSKAEFMPIVKNLAPFYEGDEDLRKFIASSPHLAPVLERLVEYGAGSITGTQA